MSLEVRKTALAGVVVLKPRVFGDDRGYFLESFNARDFYNATQQHYSFVQDNHSKSSHGVLRGLHYQVKRPQGKLIRVLEGAIFDVAVDIREGSPTFGNWVGVELSAENKEQLWVPPDFAHGFVVLSATAQVLYKATEFYAPEHERSILWNDRDINIAWPKVIPEPILSNKDQAASVLSKSELPRYQK